MKRVISFFPAIFLLTLCLCILTPIQAQEETTTIPETTTLTATPISTPTSTDTAITSATGIDVELQIEAQSAWTKKIPLKLRINPKIEGKRLKVTWVLPTNLQSNQATTQYYNYSPGQLLVLENKVTPLRPGTYKLTAEVEIYGTDSNYVNSDTKTIEINNNLIVTPPTSQYRIAVITKYLIIALLIAGGIVLVFVGIKLFRRVINYWINKEVSRPT